MNKTLFKELVLTFLRTLDARDKVNSMIEIANLSHKYLAFDRSSSVYACFKNFHFKKYTAHSL